MAIAVQQTGQQQIGVSRNYPSTSSPAHAPTPASHRASHQAGDRAQTRAAGVTLRAYQQEALDAINAAHQAGRGRALVVLPTGTGKTVIFNSLVASWRVPTVILAHREELLTQAREKLLTLWPDADVGIVGAGYNEGGHAITIGSVQSLSKPRRLAALSQAGIRLLIVDEAHHTLAASYRRVLEAVGAGKPDGGAFLLGVTATPDRADGKSIIDSVYGEPVYQATLPEMIRHGHLANLTGVCVRTHTRLDGVATRLGDFAEGELAAVVNVLDRNEQIVKAWQRHASERATLAFCASVDHAHDLAAAFRDAGVTAEALDGETPRQLRHDLLAAFASGALRVLCNCAVLTEGFDAPTASCVILARPTQSRALYVQCVGRGTRPAPGKRDCLILDVADVSSKHKLTLQTLPRLAGQSGYVNAISGEDARPGNGNTQATADEGGTFDMQASLNAAPVLRSGHVIDAAVNLLDGFEWQAVGNGDYTLAVAQGKAVFKLALGADGYTAWAIWPDGYQQELTTHGPVSLDWAQTLAERAALNVAQEQAHFVDNRAIWRTREPTDKQLWLLKKHRIKHNPDTITRGEASDLLGMVFQGRVRSA